MKSQTSLAARNCRLQEWSQMVHSCNNRPIGMSVNEWCRVEHGGQAPLTKCEQKFE